MSFDNNIYLEFTVKGEQLTRTDQNRIAGGTRNSVRARFALLDDWIGITPIAIFSKGVKTFQVLTVPAEQEIFECDVPNEMTESEGHFTICVFGGDIKTTTTEKAYIAVIRSKYADDEELIRANGGNILSFIKTVNKRIQFIRENRDGAAEYSTDGVSWFTFDSVWYPKISEEGDISWVRKVTREPPEIVNLKGEPGTKGEKGDTGERGEQGLQGIQGETGPQGSQGIQGPAGNSGAKGEKGEPGTQGETGPQGAQGIQGAKGEKGEAGADGTSVTILGSYETETELRTEHPTGNIGDSYLVQGDLFVWSATVNDWNNIGHIKGPKGDTGESGKDGEQGEPGMQGETGPQGAQGIQGYTGAQGPQGLTGEQGPQGFTGPQGPQGIQGNIGPQGTQGSKGDTGTAGTSAVTKIQATNDFTTGTLPAGAWGGVY